MGYSEFDGHSTPAWNVGRKVGPKRALKQKEVWAICFWLDQDGRLRDRALFDLAIDSKLRGRDLVRVRIDDLVRGNSIRDRATIIQCKTGEPIDSLSALIREDLGLRLTCEKCGHTAEPDIDELRHQVKLRGGFWSKFTDLPTYLRCGQCGCKSFRHEIV